jgi:molecular chaperone DnaK
MADNLQKFYKAYCLKFIDGALRKAVGHPPNVATDKALFTQVVINPGWESLPLPIRMAGRQKMRWDDFLQEARKEAYIAADSKIAFRPDAGARVLALLVKMFPVEPAEASTTFDAAASQGPPLARRVTPTASPSAVSTATAPSEPSIGIDLGTTYSVVAHVDAHGRPCTIINSAGDLITPSVILLDSAGPVIGKEAVLAAPMEPERIAVCVKRDMGARTYRKKVNEEYLPPEVLSSLILRALKEDAERKLGPVKKAVVTVPAYFDEARRRATVDAGALAGLEVLDIINEPTAAAICYGFQIGYLDKTAAAVGDKPLRVLVYDLGGGTFDVTIVEIVGNSFKAIATDGDVTLGGRDWDEKLVEIAAERVKAELREDPRHNPNTLQELWIAAESAKKTLTERTKTTMYVNHLGSRHKLEITRQEFEEATASLVGRTRTTTEIVVRQAGLKWADIDKVLLVGGSSRMPMIQSMLEEIAGKPPERSVSPDEAVAHGAALYADLLMSQQGQSSRGQSFSVTNVNSHSLGIVGFDKLTGRKKNQILIPKNTQLPHSFQGTFKTHKENQQNVVIRIVEGESERPEACSQIGVCKVEPLPSNLPAGWPIYVRYAYLANGQLQVFAQVKGQSKAVVTTFERENNMADEEISLWRGYLESQALS